MKRENLSSSSRRSRRLRRFSFRNEDFRILGLRGFIYKPPRPPKSPKITYKQPKLYLGQLGHLQNRQLLSHILHWQVLCTCGNNETPVFGHLSFQKKIGKYYVPAVIMRPRYFGHLSFQKKDRQVLCTCGNNETPIFGTLSFS